MEDLIKRSDAIEAMEQRYQDILRIFKRKVKDGERAIALDMIGCIKSLPSADRPQGEWVWHEDEDICNCSECEFEIDVTGCIEPMEYVGIFRYCPNCGARMKGANDE